MNHGRQLILLGKNGEPLDTTIQAALIRMSSRVVRQFPLLQDEVALVDVLEKAGHRIAACQQRAGPLANLHGYAWVTLRSVATSFMRRGSSRLVQRTMEPEASEALLSSAPAVRHTPQQIEQQILLREVLNTLTTEERLICIWKHAGFSSQEIAQRLGRSIASVDTAFSRSKDRLRKLLGPPVGRLSPDGRLNDEGGSAVLVAGQGKTRETSY